MNPLHTTPVEVLVADPPWPFADKLPGEGRGAEKHYDILSIPDIIRFPLPVLAKDALLILWRVGSMQPEALDVVRAWGFTVKSELVWVKTRGDELDENDEKSNKMGMGHYVRNEHEVALICTRGSFKVADRGVRSTVRAPIGEHSEKPARFFELVERLAGAERRGRLALCELFGRVPRLGWHVYGNELPGGYAGPGPTAREAFEEQAAELVLISSAQEKAASNAGGVMAFPTQAFEDAKAKLGGDPNVTAEDIREAAGAIGIAPEGYRWKAVLDETSNSVDDDADHFDAVPHEDVDALLASTRRLFDRRERCEDALPKGGTELIEVTATSDVVTMSEEKVDDGKPKRRRRTKAEMAAARAEIAVEKVVEGMQQASETMFKAAIDAGAVKLPGTGNAPAESAGTTADSGRPKAEPPKGADKTKARHVLRGVAEGLITAEQGADIDAAMVLLQYRAPAGWFWHRRCSARPSGSKIYHKSPVVKKETLVDISLVHIRI